MDINELGTIVAIIVGIYGAIFSTFLFVRKTNKERRKIKVVCEEIIMDWPDTPDKIVDKYAAINVRGINISGRPVVIAAAGFHLSDRTIIEKIGDDANLPKKIEDGESIGVSFGIASLRNNLEIQTHESGIMNQIREVFKKNRFLSRIIDLRFCSPIYIAKSVDVDEEGFNFDK